jgi:GNAT superfamily N-acetyltransferase
VSFPYRIEELNSQHDRSEFSCGTAALDRYIQQQASQDVRREVSKCFVAVEAGATKVAGFYTLAASGLPIDTLPPDIQRRLPRYPLVPVARLGRLAVDQSHKGRKLGATLLSDAFLRASRAEMGVFAVQVDAKDESAEAFYLHYGFVLLEPRKLFMPLATAKKR